MDVQVNYQDNRILHATDIAKTQGKNNFLYKRASNLTRYQEGYIVGCTEWLYADLKKYDFECLKGKHISGTEVEAQVLYHEFKKRALEYEMRHRQLYNDNAKEIEEIEKELEFLSQCALSVKEKVQELHEEFDQ